MKQVLGASGRLAALSMVAAVVVAFAPEVPLAHAAFHGGVRAPQPTVILAAAPAGFNPAEGAKLFANTCAVCHGAQGKGVPGAFPPLAGDPVVNATDPTEQIETVLHGAHGRVINGKTYGATMPPFGGQLSDLQIMEIINHERSSWGNHGPLITTAQVAAVRAKKK